MLGNGGAFLLEDAAYPCYRPEDAAVGAIRRPVQVLVGEAGAPWAPPMADWLAGRLGREVASMPGGHGPTWTSYRSAPAPVQEALCNSPSAEVRTTIAAFDRHQRTNAAQKED